MSLPTVLAPADTGHIYHHEGIHVSLGGMDTDIASGETGHIAAHEAIAAALGLGLPASIDPGDAGHLEHHETIHAAITVGPRGLNGVQADTDDVPGFPTSGYTTVSPGAGTIQAAIAAGSNGTVFVLETGTYSLTSRCEPKLGQEFWGQAGVVISYGSGTVDQAFYGLSGRTGVKLFNLKFTAFVDRAVDASAETGWEIGYCEADGADTMIYGFTAHHVHNCKVYGTKDAGINLYQTEDAIIEDNDVGPVCSVIYAGQGNKWVGTQRVICRHNRFHEVGTGATTLAGCGLWLDYMNFDVEIAWNIFEDNDGFGLFFEANYWDDGLDQPGVFENLVRFNLFQNNGGPGIGVSGSSFVEAHHNTLMNNQLTHGEGEISLDFSLAQQTTQNAELTGNSFHHNVITPKEEGRGASFDPEATLTGYADYVSNAKNNDWDFNEYHLGTGWGGGGDDYFYWEASLDVPDWLALPQDTNATVEYV